MAEELDKPLLDLENFNREDIDLDGIPIDEAFEQLRTSRAGLSTEDAEARLLIFGPNKLEEKPENKILKFPSFKWNPLSWVKEAAAVMAIVLANGGGAITKRMTAIEEMAGMDVLCSDKTGTLTLNRLTVDRNLIEVINRNMDKDMVVLLAARAARLENQDAIDAAVVNMLADPKEARANITEVHFLPFNSVAKRTAITYIGSFYLDLLLSNITLLTFFYIRNLKRTKTG